MKEHIGWIIVVNLALYFRTLRFKFVSDDLTVFMLKPDIKGWKKAWARFIGAAKFLSPSVRFMRVNNKPCAVVVKTEEFEHLVALLLHIAICISIYFALGHTEVSFIAALLYSVNPVNNQATIWPGGRGYVLPILSLMLSMALPILSPALLYFCSWFTIGFLAPLSLIGSERWYLLALMPFIWWLHSRKWTTAINLKAKSESYHYDRLMGPHKIVIFIKTYGFYFLFCLFPWRITFYHNFLQSMAGNEIMRKRAWAMDRYFVIGCVALLGTAYACLSWSLFSWALVAFFITIAPFCNVIRSNQEIAERFCALPNIFLMFALAQVISAYPVLIASALVFYATRTFYTIGAFQDEYTITEYAVIEDPRAWFAWHVRALKRWSHQSYKEALTFWVMAKLLSPQEFKILINISASLRLLNNHKEAEQFLELAEKCIVRGQEEEAQAVLAEHRRGKISILT